MILSVLHSIDSLDVLFNVVQARHQVHGGILGARNNLTRLETDMIYDLVNDQICNNEELADKYSDFSRRGAHALLNWCMQHYNCHGYPRKLVVARQETDFGTYGGGEFDKQYNNLYFP